MPMIEGKDGDIVAVKIADAWVENIQTKDGDIKLVVKLRGETEDGHHGTATLWLTDEIRPKQTKAEIFLALEALETLGLEDGNIENLVDLFGKDAEFRLWVKEGKKQPQYFLNTTKREVVDLADAVKMVEVIRGKARKKMAELSGEPVQGDDNMMF